MANSKSEPASGSTEQKATPVTMIPSFIIFVSN